MESKSMAKAEKVVIIKGRKGQCIFFDDKDRGVFSWACSMLPNHMKNDLRTFERCGKVTKMEFSVTSVTITVEPWEWSADKIAAFLCKVYDSYFRRHYKRDGKQTEYQVMG